VVWQKETGEEGVCWLYSPGAVLGELGQRGGREVGVHPRISWGWRCRPGRRRGRWFWPLAGAG
jgi:hypothetical protein